MRIYTGTSLHLLGNMDVRKERNVDNIDTHIGARQSRKKKEKAIIWAQRGETQPGNVILLRCSAGFSRRGNQSSKVIDQD